MNPLRTGGAGAAMKMFLVAIVSCVCAPGCSSTQLNANTLDVGGSVAYLYREQALKNVSVFIDDPANTLPSQIDITTGQIETANGITPTLTVPLGNQVVKSGSTLVTQTIQENVRSLALGVSATWNQTWNVTPVSDGNALRRLRALYKYVLGKALTTGTGGVEKSLADQPSLEAQFIADYLDMGTPTPDGKHPYQVDIHRLEEPACVVCVPKGSFADFLNAQPTTSSPPHAATTAGAGGPPSTVLVAWTDLHVNPKLRTGWIYWRDPSDPQHDNWPFPADCRLPQCHSLGHHGSYDLAMMDKDFTNGALGDFLLFLLPQADPRLPSFTTANK